MAPILLCQPTPTAAQDDSPVSKLNLSTQSQLFSWQSCVSSIKQSFVGQLVYLAQDVNAFLDSSESESDTDGIDDMDEHCFTSCSNPEKLSVSPASVCKSKQAPKKSAVVAPSPAANQQAITLASVVLVADTEDKSSPTRSTTRETSEVCAAVTIQRMIRQRNATAATAHTLALKQEPEAIADQVEAHTGSVFTSFSRVSRALRGLFSSETATNDTRSQYRAAQRIQRQWRQHASRTKSTPPSIPESMLQSQAESLTSSPLPKRKRSRDCDCGAGDELSVDAIQDSQVDDELAALAAHNEKDDGCESEYVFVAKRCASVPPPASAIRPVALKSRLLVARSTAACVIQSAWRCVLARLHVMALRRLSAYELECESVMPEVRSQMRVVQQRLNELRERSSSNRETDFDDDWL